MSSIRYRKMATQINHLRKAFLPRNLQQDIINFTQKLSLRALSFRILSHGEIESYLEDRSLEIATAADLAWKNQEKISKTTFCLLAFSGHPMAPLPDTLRAPPKKKQTDWQALITPDHRLSKSIAQLIHHVKHKNHGIKEDSVVSMMLPIGVDPSLIEEVLLADLNDLASKRGEAAHGRAFGHVQKGVNPKDEYDQIKRILESLLEIDKIYDKLYKGARHK